MQDLALRVAGRLTCDAEGGGGAEASMDARSLGHVEDELSVEAPHDGEQVEDELPVEVLHELESLASSALLSFAFEVAPGVTSA